MLNIVVLVPLAPQYWVTGTQNSLTVEARCGRSYTSNPARTVVGIDEIRVNMIYLQ